MHRSAVMHADHSPGSGLTWGLAKVLFSTPLPEKCHFALRVPGLSIKHVTEDLG